MCGYVIGIGFLILECPLCCIVLNQRPYKYISSLLFQRCLLRLLLFNMILSQNKKKQQKYFKAHYKKRHKYTSLHKKI